MKVEEVLVRVSGAVGMAAEGAMEGELMETEEGEDVEVGAENIDGLRAKLGPMVEGDEVVELLVVGKCGTTDGEEEVKENMGGWVKLGAEGVD